MNPTNQHRQPQPQKNQTVPALDSQADKNRLDPQYLDPTDLPEEQQVIAAGLQLEKTGPTNGQLTNPTA